MTTIVQRLEAHNEYCESAEARQLRKDAAEHIRTLEADLAASRRQVQQLEAVIQRRASQQVSRRAA